MGEVISFEKSLLKLNPETDDFIFEVDDLLESIQEKNYELLVPSVFKFFEINSESDCGAPGTLVHIIESFYPNYKNLLLRSLSEKPNYVSILMVNRILNSELAEEEHLEYIHCLETVILKQDASHFLKEETQQFIDYQSEKTSWFTG